jgi:hypothetical protein
MAGGEVVKQRWNDHPSAYLRRTQNRFLHAPQVFIDQAREGRDNVLLKVGHVFSLALITAEKAGLFDGVGIFYLSSLSLFLRD